MKPGTVAEAKDRARALRAARAARGHPISHARALEAVARAAGARDWNTLRASLPDAGDGPGTGRIAPLRPGDAVTGRYLGQAFTGRIAALTAPGPTREVTIRLDVPIDTVRFAGFSNLRRVLRATVGRDGRSAACGSDGVPHLILDP